MTSKRQHFTIGKQAMPHLTQIELQIKRHSCYCHVHGEKFIQFQKGWQNILIV